MHTDESFSQERPRSKFIEWYCAQKSRKICVVPSIKYGRINGIMQTREHLHLWPPSFMRPTDIHGDWRNSSNGRTKESPFPNLTLERGML
jgi:hypothetical protein